MSEAARQPIIEYLARSRDLVSAAIADMDFLATAAAIVERISAALAAGNKLLLIGNGGSAGDAQHIAGEFLSRLNYDRASRRRHCADHGQLGHDRDRQ
jgi:D-sedoheptulose 7-phosphate isomerase